MEKSLAKTGAQMASAGAALTKGLTLPLVALGGFAAKAAIDFESSFAGVKKTVNATGDEFKVMAQGFRDMAKSMPVSVTELNKIGEAAGQLGISKENILDFTRVMAKLGATTNLTSDQAATGIAQIQNIFHASGQNTENFASALVALGNAGASTESEILDLTTRLAGAGAQIGLTQAQTLGFASAMANVGINAEAGGTALSTVMSKISVAADMGGKKLTQLAAVAGMSGEAFATLFKANAAEGLARFIEGLGHIKDDGGNLSKVLADIGMSSIRVSDTLKRLAGNTDNVRDSLNLAMSAWVQNSALSQEYGQRSETTASQLQILWNKANDVAITLGQALLPTLREAVKAMDPLITAAASMAKWFQQLPVPVQAGAIAFAGLLAAIGPALMLIGSMAKGISAILPLIGGLAPVWTTVMSVFEVGGSIIAGLVTAFGGWAVLLGGALIAAIVAVGVKTGALQAVFSALWDALKGTVSFVYDLGTILVWLGGEVLKGIWQWFQDVGDKLWWVASAFTDTKDAISNAVSDWIPEWVKDSLSWVVDKLGAMKDAAHETAAALRETAPEFNAGAQRTHPQQAANAVAKFKASMMADVIAGNVQAPNMADLLAANGDKEFANLLNSQKHAALGALDGVEKLTAAQKKAKKEAADFAKEGDKYTGRAAIASAEEWMKHLEKEGSLEKFGAEAIKEMTKALDGAMDAYRHLGPEAGTASVKMLSAWAALQKASPTIITELGADTLNAAAQSAWAKAQVARTVGRLGMPNDQGPQLMLQDMPGIVGEMSLATMTTNQESIQKAKLIVGPFRQAFDQLGKDLPGIIFGAIQNGGSVLGAIGAAAGAQFGGQFQKALEKAGGDLSKVSAGNKALGVASVGISSAFMGYDLGAKLGKGKGALAGAGSGAAAGIPLAAATGGLSIAVGAGIGALAGLFGGRKKDKEAAAQMEQQREEILKQYGGMEKLTALADSLHVSLGNAFSTKKPEEFRAAVEKLNTALEAQKVKMEGLNEIVSGVNARGTAFSESLKSGGANPGSEGEFNRVGAMALGGLGASMASGAGLLASLTQLKPVLDALNASQAQFNFNGSEATQRLLEMNAAVNANLPSFQALDADGQILNGMLKANWADMGLFAATSSDVAAKIAEITAGGMPMAQALGLNQPVLQSLWEAQQKFGFSTDEATQALLNQAVTQGIVGPQMKDPMDKLLDVMMAIGKVLGADLPAYLSELPGAAKTAADGMSDAFGSVKGPDLTGKSYNTAGGAPGSDGYTGPGGDLNDMFPGGFNPGGSDVHNRDIPALAGGGLVTGKTLAWIGESGPELVIPASDFASILGAAVSPLSGIGAAFGVGLSDARLAKIAAHSQQGGPNVEVPQVEVPGSITTSSSAKQDAGGWRDRIQTGVSGGKSTIIFEREDGRQTAEYLVPFIAEETTRLRLNG